MSSRSSGARRSVDAVLLVVEDDPDIRDVVVDLLIDAGHVVRFASTLAEARSLCSRALPMALILDLNLPDGSSEQLLVELAAANVRIPTVIMTAAHDGSEVARRSGTKYLRKPFAIDELLAIVDELVSVTPVTAAR